MATVTVRVTGTDVRRGLPGDPLRCPVARALRRATGRRWAACRKTLRLNVEEEGGLVFVAGEVPAPPEADAFMQDYDHGREVRPFAFTLDVPDEWLIRAGVPVKRPGRRVSRVADCTPFGQT